jgi:hypothetical protein
MLAVAAVEGARIVEVVHTPTIMKTIIILIVRNATMQIITVLTFTKALKRMITSIVFKDVRLIFITQIDK